tara:strand:- start:1067 stop:1360 length:294 start_codon:yes stop_codon:yes gene_type:complete
MKHLGIDKYYHYCVGQIIFTCCYVVGLSWVISLTVVAVIAAAKEIYDKVSGKGTPEVLDFIATVVGTLIPLLLLYKDTLATGVDTLIPLLLLFRYTL